MSQRTERVPSMQELQAELCRPGRILVFIDDTGTSSQPLGRDLVRDYVVHAAIVVRSDDYPSFLLEHSNLMTCHSGVEEFHTVDVVNGRGQWKGKSIATRLDALAAFSDVLERVGQVILHVGIGAEQYAELTSQVDKRLLTPTNWRWKSHSEAARAVLLKTVEARARAVLGALPLIVVEDADNERKNCCEQIFPRESDVYGDGVFRVDSSAVAGVQLADLAAYPLNRAYHVTSRLKQDRSPGPFDEPILDLYLRNRDKYKNVLNGSAEEVSA